MSDIVIWNFEASITQVIGKRNTTTSVHSLHVANEVCESRKKLQAGIHRISMQNMLLRLLKDKGWLDTTS